MAFKLYNQITNEELPSMDVEGVNAFLKDLPASKCLPLNPISLPKETYTSTPITSLLKKKFNKKKYIREIQEIRPES